MHNTAMFDQPVCPPFSRSSSTTSPKTHGSLIFRGVISTMLYRRAHGLQALGSSGSRPVSASRSAALVELADRSQQALRRDREQGPHLLNSRPLHLTASGRHLGETMYIINQLKFEAGHNKPLRRTSASSWQTRHSSKEATDFEEAPPTDHSARQRGRHRGFQGPTARPRREEARQHGRHRGF